MEEGGGRWIRTTEICNSGVGMSKALSQLEAGVECRLFQLTAAICSLFTYCTYVCMYFLDRIKLNSSRVLLETFTCCGGPLQQADSELGSQQLLAALDGTTSRFVWLPIRSFCECITRSHKYIYRRISLFDALSSAYLPLDSQAISEPQTSFTLSLHLYIDHRSLHHFMSPRVTRRLHLSVYDAIYHLLC